MQINHPPTGMQCPTIGFAHDRAPACRQHHTVAIAQLGNHCLLAITKTRFAFLIEDPRDIGARAQFNFLIGIFEWQAQLFGQQPADGAFSSPHRSNKNQISHRINDSQQSPDYS
ncbi:hypothetical protein D3C76_1408700 [compost metagenome]